MDKRTAKAAQGKIDALAEAPSPEAAHAEAKANFEKALAKTKAQTGEDPPKAVQEEAKAESAPEPEKAKEPAPKKPKTTTKAAEPDRYSALERQVADLTKRLSEKEKPAKKEEPKPDRMSEASKFLKEKFGDEEGESIAQVLKYVLDPLTEELAANRKTLQDAVERGKKLHAKSARQTLGEKYGRLKESDDAWSMVQSQGDALIAKDAERFTSPEEAYAHVAESLYGAPDEVEAETEEDEDDAHAEEVAAAEVTSPTRTRSEKKLSPQQRSRAVFDHLLKHPDDVVGARRLARQSPI